MPVDHAARVMRVITWSSKGVLDGEKTDLEDSESLATVLDKLMAWEKKLYEEVKVHFYDKITDIYMCGGEVIITEKWTQPTLF